MLWLGNNYNNDLNGNNNLNNNGRFVGGIVKPLKRSWDIFFVFDEEFLMTVDFYSELCSLENIKLAAEKATKGKRGKLYVIEFNKDLDKNLEILKQELLSMEYSPKRLTTFILHDPKTRKISKSNFRDRVVHHALINIIESIFDKTFIFDNYANRVGKGTFAAIQRFDFFKRKVSKNNTHNCFVLKADVRHYFETVNHSTLLSLIAKKVGDERILWLINQILKNYKTKSLGKGMPLGNLTSQFFANVYLNELDQFVKHELKAKYYVRYVDDFVILHENPRVLAFYKEKINQFLKEKLDLELHPDKSKIKTLSNGIDFLGFRIFYYHKLVRKKNLNKFERKFSQLKKDYEEGLVDREKVVEKFEGWLAYVSNANTYKYRRHLIRQFNQFFPIQKEKPIDVINVNKQENFNKKVERSFIDYSPMKTLYLLKKGLSIQQISEKRKIKTGTVWQHLATLIENNQLPIWTVLPKNKINKILPAIKTETDKLKTIKNKIFDQTISYDEINCVLASVKLKKKEKSLTELTKWYQKVHCHRKCYQNPKQISICKTKFEQFTKQNTNLKITRKDFLNLFNKHMTICILPQKQKLKYITWQEFKTKIKTTNNSLQISTKKENTQIT